MTSAGVDMSWSLSSQWEMYATAAAKRATWFELGEGETEPKRASSGL